MPSRSLIDRYERARAAHDSAVPTFIEVLIEMIMASLAEVLPRAHQVEVRGEINEDWIPTLRIQRVLDANGAILFDVEDGHDQRTVENLIDELNVELLDPLIEVTGDEFMGRNVIGPSTAGV
jgi:hypothetical protein